MQAARVIPSLTPGKDLRPCMCLGLPETTLNQLALQIGKEVLRHGVAVRINHRAHAVVHSRGPAALTNGNTGVLSTLIAVMNQLFRLTGQ